MGGAVIAAVAAARAKRLQAIIDAFRVAGATAPARARSIESLGLVHGPEMRELMEEGVLAAGPKAGDWFLSEAVYIERRDRRRPIRPVAAIVALLVILIGGIIALGVQHRGSP